MDQLPVNDFVAIPQAFIHVLIANALKPFPYTRAQTPSGVCIYRSDLINHAILRPEQVDA
jgi:hypothetical protein